MMAATFDIHKGANELNEYPTTVWLQVPMKEYWGEKVKPKPKPKPKAKQAAGAPAAKSYPVDCTREDRTNTRKRLMEFSLENVPGINKAKLDANHQATVRLNSWQVAVDPWTCPETGKLVEWFIFNQTIQSVDCVDCIRFFFSVYHYTIR